MLGVFVKQIVVFNIGFGFCVFNSIWEHRLKIFFDPKNRKIDPQKIEHFPRSVNNFRTEHLGGYFWDFWSPYVAEASLGRGSCSWARGGGRKRAVPAETVDTIRGGRKGDPQHKIIGKTVGGED